MYKSVVVRFLSGAMAMCIIISLGCGPTTYVVPNYKEFTTGGIFADKYFDPFSGSKSVRLEGQFLSLSTTVASGVEQLVFQMTVPEGLKPIDVYATRSFASQLYEIKEGSSIVVYGNTIVVTARSRIDRGVIGKELAVRLHKIEKK